MTFERLTVQTERLVQLYERESAFFLARMKEYGSTLPDRGILYRYHEQAKAKLEEARAEIVAEIEATFEPGDFVVITSLDGDVEIRKFEYVGEWHVYTRARGVTTGNPLVHTIMIQDANERLVR